MTRLTLPRPSLPAQDLHDAVSLTAAAEWARLRGRRLFVTGGTGFVGKWLLATLLQADREHGLACEVTVLSRHPSAFREQVPELANNPSVRLLEGDVRELRSAAARFDVVVHAATDVATANSALETFDTCVTGTRRVIDFAVEAGATEFLLISSGAVYGRQPPTLAKVPEDYGGAPDPLAPSSAYGQGKRISEWIANAVAAEHGLRVMTARLFAFVGPHLALDRHFAIGNFLRDALTGEPVVVGGDGTDLRSYLYASEMAGWCWKILLGGRAGAAYNVGGDEAVAIGALAQRVVDAVASSAGAIVRGKPQPGVLPGRYVPDIGRAALELGLRPHVGLDEALRRTAAWYRSALVA